MNRHFRSYLARGEKIGGIIFLPLYLFLLPLGLSWLNLQAGNRWNVSLGDAQLNLAYYAIACLLALWIFRRFLSASFAQFSEHLLGSLWAILTGFVLYFLLNLAMSWVLSLIPGALENANNSAITAEAQRAPQITMAMILFLSPFVEETLFRGFVFGGLREKHRVLAYVVSILLFGVLHIWQYVVITGDFSYAVAFLQYIAPSFALAWCYEKAGNIWAPMGLHSLINAMALILIFGAA